MKKSKYWFLQSSLLVLALASTSWAISSTTQNGAIVMTKSLWGATGNANLTSGSVSLGFALGEPASGYEIVGGAGAVVSVGYYGGRSSHSGATQPVKIAGIQAESIGPVVNSIQLGTLLQGRVRVDLVGAIQGANLLPNISITLVQDRQGQIQNGDVPYFLTFDPIVNTVYLNAVGGWLGNSLYEVTITNALQLSNNFTTPTTLTYRFVTLLDPAEGNVLYTPVDAPSVAAAAGDDPINPPNRALRVDFAPGASKDYSYLVSNDNPLSSPLQVDPQAIVDANRKIAQDNGPYSTPVSLQELVLYDSQGTSNGALSAPARISWSYRDQGGLMPGSPAPVRSQSLALYSLDTTHHLWVRLPASEVDENGKTVNVSVSKLSVFALMGSGQATTSFASVFPVPWRPHGPNAGSGSGQTGTEAGGITFTNLPPECTIRLYTLSGDRVVELRHSDATGSTGQETWLGLTADGKHAASGVYLWVVQSSVDKKTGKLIIIR